MTTGLYPASGGGGAVAGPWVKVSASVNADVQCLANVATVAAAIPLTVGLWLVTATATILAAAGVNLDMLLVSDGALQGVFEGPVITSARGVAGNPITVNIDLLVTVATAGNLQLQIMPGAASAVTVKALSTIAGTGPASGIVAIKKAA